MNIILFITIFIAMYFIGTWAWTQIVGCIKHFKEKGMIYLIPIALWTAVMIGTWYFTLKHLSEDVWAWILGSAVSLIQTLRDKDI